MEIVLNSQQANLFWKTVYGEPLTLEEQQQWNDWREAHPEQTLHKMLQSEMQLCDEVENTRVASEEALWRQFDERFPGQRGVRISYRQPLLQRLKWAAAACFGLLVIMGIVQYLRKTQPEVSGPVITVVPARASGPGYRYCGSSGVG